MAHVKTKDYELWNSPKGFPILIEAPHRHFDLYSGIITETLSDMLGARFTLMNVQHRTIYDCARGGIENEASTEYQMIHEKISRTHLVPTVQIHGMTDHGLDIIISSGSDKPFGPVHESSLFPILCRRIPNKITFKQSWDGCDSALGTRWGATQNPQGHFNNKYAIPFAHVELAYWIRKHHQTTIAEALAASIKEWYTSFWLGAGVLEKC